jgi:hypothetical protein
MVKTTFTDTTPEDLKHKNKADHESALKMATAKKKWVIDYQTEREKKREYVRQHVVAQGLETTELWQKLQNANDNTKNALVAGLDDVTMTELTNIVEEMAQDDK